MDESGPTARFAGIGVLKVTVSIDCRERTVVFEAAGDELRSRITGSIEAITQFGYGGSNSDNLFTNIEVSSLQVGEAGLEIGMGVEAHSVEHRGIIGYRDQVTIDGFPRRKLQNVLTGVQFEGLQAGQTLLPVVCHQRPAP